MHKDALIVYLIISFKNNFKVCRFALDMQRITLGNEKVFLFSALINKLTLSGIANMMSQLHFCQARYTLHAITQTQLK